MAKKIIGWILLIILAIAASAGVYLFITKGYQNKKINLPEAIQNLTNEKTTTEGNPETQNTTSDKISLIVMSPQNGATLNTTNVAVIGRTSPNADVFVNDQAGKADKTGNFSIIASLVEGENPIVVTVNDSEGNVTQQTLSVTVVSF